MWQQRGNNTNALIQPFRTLSAVSLNSVYAAGAQSINSIGQETQGIENIIGHNRLHNVKLELAVFYTEGHSQIIGNYLIAGLVHYLGDNGVNLTRHDGRTWLTRRQRNFAEACSRTGGHQAQVIGNFNQRKCRSLQAGGQISKDIRITGSINKIVRGSEAFTGNKRKLFANLFDIFGIGIQTGAYCCCSHVHGVQQLAATTDVITASAHRGSKGFELQA